MKIRSQQRGAGMLRLLFVIGTLAIYGIIGAKVFPLYSNHFKIKKAVHAVASQGITDPTEVRKALERRWMVDDMTIIEPTDIKVQRGERGKVSLVYDYEARAHLFYNADISLVFTGSEPVSGNE